MLWLLNTASHLGNNVLRVLFVQNFEKPISLSRVVEMDFYGRNDIALGGFLERYCFHNNYSCPSASCQSPMASHVRRFVHDTSSIVIIIRQLANPVNCNAVASGATSADDRAILMWSWCKKCKQASWSHDLCQFQSI